jgi:hypothetical protein
MKKDRSEMFDKLKKAQKEFDEKWIAREKEHWKKKFQNKSVPELEEELRKLGDQEYDALDSMKKGIKRSFGFSWGSEQVIIDRSREAKRQALKELLEERKR